MKKQRRIGPFVALALLVVPLIEIWALIQVGQVIGVGWTIVALVVSSIIGTWLIGREGRRVYSALTASLQRGQMPTRELADGALVVLGGALMLSPGFVTDVFGIVLILPFTRPLFRGLITAWVTRKAVTSAASTFGAPAGFGVGGGGFGEDLFNERRPAPGAGGPVVRGDVVD